MSTYIGADGRTYSLGHTYWQRVFIGIRTVGWKAIRVVGWLVGIVMFGVILLLLPSAPHVAAPSTIFWLFLIFALLNSGEPPRR